MLTAAGQVAVAAAGGGGGGGAAGGRAAADDDVVEEDDLIDLTDPAALRTKPSSITPPLSRASSSALSSPSLSTPSPPRRRLRRGKCT